MGKQFENITPELTRWLSEQKVFFVATAPTSAEGHINCSPKGGDSFRVVGPREVLYADLTGSGVETIAHLRENRRIVVMFCAFTGAPRIVRLHGVGEVIYPADPRFALSMTSLGALIGVRAIIRIEVNRVSDSCGMAVPYFEFTGPREELRDWAVAKGDAGLAEYRAKRNQKSVDGLPGYRAPTS